MANHNHRTLITLSGIWELTLVIRQCVYPDCPNYHLRLRPEEEGGWALPHGEFGLDVILSIGFWHFYERYSGSEIHQALQGCGINIAQRSVTHLIQRYEQLKTWPSDRVRRTLQQQGRVLLAIDRLMIEHEAKYEVLGIIRDCLSAEILLVCILHDESDLEILFRSVSHFLRRHEVPVKGLIFHINEDEAVSSLFLSIFPGVPYQLHQFHYFADVTQPFDKAHQHTPDN